MLRRSTFQCSLILETVKKLHNHPTADEVYREILKTKPNISRATVYRNLEKLCEMDMLKKRFLWGDAERFDDIVTHHYHAKCMKCGKIFDVEIKDQINTADYENAIDGFQIEDHDIVFKGYCSLCKQKNKSSDS